MVPASQNLVHCAMCRRSGLSVGQAWTQLIRFPGNWSDWIAMGWMCCVLRYGVGRSRPRMLRTCIFACVFTISLLIEFSVRLYVWCIVCLAAFVVMFASALCVCSFQLCLLEPPSFRSKAMIYSLARQTSIFHFRGTSDATFCSRTEMHLPSKPPTYSITNTYLVCTTIYTAEIVAFQGTAS